MFGNNAHRRPHTTTSSRTDVIPIIRLSRALPATTNPIEKNPTERKREKQNQVIWLHFTTIQAAVKSYCNFTVEIVYIEHTAAHADRQRDRVSRCAIAAFRDYWPNDNASTLSHTAAFARAHMQSQPNQINKWALVCVVVGAADPVFICIFILDVSLSLSLSVYHALTCCAFSA